MKLSSATIRPGKVIKVLDNGEIKASAPGLFSFVDDPEKMPPIMPWQIGSNCNSFSQPNVNDEIWIMNFKDNPRQLYWFRKDRVSDNDNINLKEENVEILCNKDINGEWATIYLSDGSGWVVSKGESIMQIRPNGSIKLSNGFKHRTIDINNKGISLGSEGKSAHPAAYGDKVVESLNALAKILRQFSYKAMMNPYTMKVGMDLMKSLGNFEKTIPNITSTNVTLD